MEEIKVAVIQAACILFILVVLIIFLDVRDSRRKEEKTTDETNAPTHIDQKQNSLNKSNRKNRHPSDEEHRSAEQTQWKWQNGFQIASSVLSIGAVVIAAEVYFASLASVQQAARAADEAHRQADEARAQTAIAKDNLLLSTRAWINVEDIQPGDIMFNQIGMRFQFSYELHNIGHVAAKVDVADKFIVNYTFYNKPINVMAKEFCEPTRIKSSDELMRDNGIGIVVLPDEKVPYGWNEGLDISEIHEHDHTISQFLRIPENKLRNLYFSFWLLCVNYTFPGDFKVHQTVKIRLISRINPREPETNFFLPNSGKLERNFIRVGQSPFGGEYAD